MSIPKVTRMLANISPPTSLDGIRLNAGDVRSVDVSVLRTLDAYRAAEIQHDLKRFRAKNMKIYNKLKNQATSHHPLVEDIATPIYLITRIHEGPGDLVYVGKAQSETNRFVGGHISLLKLLDPQYKEYDKFISFAVIYIRTEKGDQLPVEWVEDKKLRDAIIKDVEQSLIWKFQPEYNTHYKSEESKDFTFEMNLYDHDGSHIVLGSIRIRAASAPIHQDTLKVRRSVV